MFDYVWMLIEDFLNYLPHIALIVIILSIVGNLTFRRMK